MMKFTFAALVTLATAQNFVSCDSNATFTPVATTLSPSSIVIGQNYTVSSTGALAVAINPGAFYNVTWILGAVPYHRRKFDFCSNPELDCPVLPSSEAVLSTTSLAPLLPAGKYTWKVDFFNPDKTPIACLKSPVRLVKPE
jgi:hypothetical protein